MSRRVPARSVAVLSVAVLLLAGCTGDPESSPRPDAPPSVSDALRSRCEAIDFSDPAQGRLTFEDDFDGGTLDESRWRVRDDTYLDFDQALIRRENVTVHDGLLDIAGLRLPRSEWRTTPKSRFDWNQVRGWSSGYVDTIGTFAQRYGTFEVRAKVPSRSTRSRGVWPAFWLRANGTDGEIDVMESYGGPTIRDEDPSSTYFWNSWEESAQSYSRDHLAGRAELPRGTRIWEGFHTYGVTWSPTCLRYTFDGRTVGLVPLDARDYFTGPTFDAPFHLRLNMQVGSSFWGPADDQHTRPRFHYLVDWVRVHQSNDL